MSKKTQLRLLLYVSPLFMLSTSFILFFFLNGNFLDVSRIPTILNVDDLLSTFITD